MCLCWNDDGSMCGMEELKQRLELYHKGLYKPEMKALRDKMWKEREVKTEKRLSEIRHYKWPNDFMKKITAEEILNKQSK